LGSGGLSPDQLTAILSGFAGSPRMNSADQRREQSLPKRVSH